MKVVYRILLTLIFAGCSTIDETLPTVASLPTINPVTPTVINTSTPVPSNMLYVNAIDVPLLECPQTDCLAIRILQLGDNVIVNDTVEGATINDSREWYEITYRALGNSGLGYIHSSYISRDVIIAPTKTPSPVPVLVNTRPPAQSFGNQSSSSNSSGNSTGSACSCIDDSYNCPAFSSQSQAQACYNKCIREGVGDIHRLDGDNNGLACDGSF